MVSSFIHYGVIVYTLWCHRLYIMVSSFIHYGVIVYTLWCHRLYIMVSSFIHYGVIVFVRFIILHLVFISLMLLVLFIRKIIGKY